ncbi:MAG: hypothetical protein ACI8TP_003186 [Acidimicrobiales bacterium]
MFLTASASDRPQESAATSRSAAKETPKKKRRVLVGLVASVFLWLALCAYTLWQARGAALDGQAVLAELADVDPTIADLGAVQVDLEKAEASLGDANDSLGRWYLEPMRLLPVVGRQLSATRALAGTAETVVVDTKTVVAAADRVVGARNADRVPALLSLEVALEALVETLDEADLGPDRALVQPLADARFSAETQLAELRQRGGDGLIVVRGLRVFSDQGRYLLIGANVNEMQAGSGMPLTLGTVEANNSEFSVSSFTTVSDVNLGRGVAPLDEDVADLWGFLVPGNDFRKLALTPRYRDYSGPMALAMYRQLAGDNLSGVLTIDPVALQALLVVVGPIEVDGEVFDESNVLEYILSGQYDKFEDEDLVKDSDDLIALGAQRQDVLSMVAAQAFAGFAGGDWDPFELIEALRPVAEGRHLLAYSTDPDIQALWEFVGVAGVMEGDEIGVTMLNLGANKLDPYLDLAVVAATGPAAAESAAAGAETVVELEITVSNNAPASELNQYVLGPWDELGFADAGGYTGRLMVILPGSSSAADFVRPTQPLEVFGRDGPIGVMVTRVSLDAGESRTFKVEVAISGQLDSLTVLPSARVPSVGWQWNGTSFDDSSPREVTVGP